MMFQKQARSATLLAILAIGICGCNTKYPQVSGQVTSNGQPVADVQVLFFPVSTNDNPFPGPFAEGTTDDQGKYSLVTRDGSNGATPGLNKVELYAGGSTGGSLAAEFFGSEVTQLQSKAGGDVSAQANDSRQAGGKASKLDPDFETEFTVPENGTDAANFELTELKKPK